MRRTKFLKKIDFRGRRRRGQVIVMIALMLGFLTSLGGLAVDLVLAYAIKTSLSIATDSTALAAMRALGQGVTTAEQRAEVNRISNMIFDSNFPDGLLLTGASPRIVSGPFVHGPSVTSDGQTFVNDPEVQAGFREVRIVTEAVSPTFFMRAFGVPHVTVRSAAVAARRDTNIMMVVDRSTSLRDNNGWEPLKQAAKNFVKLFDNSGDRIGLVSYGTSSQVDVAIDHGFKSPITTAIDNQSMPPSGFSYTNTALGLWLGFAELQALNDPDALNVIVLFTDGEMTAAPMNVRVVNSDPGNGKPWCSGAAQREFVFRRPTGLAGPYELLAAPAPQPLFAHSNRTWDYQVPSDCHNLTTNGGHNNGQEVEQLLDAAAMGNCLNSNWTTTYTATNGSVISGSFEYRTDPTWSDGNMPAFCDANNFTTGGNAGKRADVIERGGRNLTLDVAQKARQSSLDVVIYTIGLGNAFSHQFMWRTANDPEFAGSTDGTWMTTNDTWAQSYILADEPKGRFIWAPNPGDLQAAFQDVGFEVARLTK